MSFTLRTSYLFVFGFCLITSPPESSGAVIAWGAAMDTTSPLDIVTTGTVVGAFNGADESAIVNGVLFGVSDPLGGISNGMLSGGTSGDAEFDKFLRSVSFGGGTSTSIDLGALVSGQTYEVQVFFGDQRNASNDRVMTFGSSTGGGTVDLEADPNNANTSPFGQFASGIFVADGVDPDLTLATNGFGNAHITAWQIRAVPEPSRAILFVLAGALMIFRRTRIG